VLRAAPHLCSLAQHAFGNYLVSKLASLPLVRPALAAAFRGHMASLLCHAQGSRVVQAFLAAAAPADAEALVSELDGRVVECALDTYGSWGVCVAYSATRAPFVLRQLSAAVVRLSLEQHGSRVVQYVLKEAGNAGIDCSAAVDRVLGGGLEELALHRFANYAVQVALRQCGAGQRDVMLGALLPRLLPLSASKHGSNVAEVVLSHRLPRPARRRGGAHLWRRRRGARGSAAAAAAPVRELRAADAAAPARRRATPRRRARKGARGDHRRKLRPFGPLAARRG